MLINQNTAAIIMHATNRYPILLVIGVFGVFIDVSNTW